MKTVCLFLTLVLFTIQANAADPAPAKALSPEAAEALAWYDTLGFPDTKGLPYVRVATGRYSQENNKTPQNYFIDGFLLSEDSDSFTIFVCEISAFNIYPFLNDFPSLTTVRFIRKSSGPEYERVSYDLLNFDKAFSEVLETAHKEALTSNNEFWWPLHRTLLFSLARASLQKGLTEKGTELLDVITTAQDKKTSGGDPRTLIEVLQQQIGDDVLERAEKDWENTAIPPEELLKVYATFGERFPKYKPFWNHWGKSDSALQYARDASEVVRKMIAEEAAHHPKPWDQMSPTEQIAESIYQLRYMHSYDLLEYVGDSHREELPSAKSMEAVRCLIDSGTLAIPQLIAALDDQTFTRSPHMQGGRPSGPKALRVSDCASELLRKYSGDRFSYYAMEDGKVDMTPPRKKAELWWADIQSKGEKQTLIDTTAAGGYLGGNTAIMLAKKYPESAIDAISAGFWATKNNPRYDEYVAAGFVYAAASLPGDFSAPFLKSLLVPNTSFVSRITAASTLFTQGNKEAIPAMINMWEDILTRMLKGENYDSEEGGEIITFLADCGDIRAINALEHNIHKLPVPIRLSIVKAFLPTQKGEEVNALGFRIPTPPRTRKEAANDVDTAIQHLLVGALEDTEKMVGVSGNFDDTSFKDPRVCDMAAYALSRRWPTKYSFNWTDDAASCDKQIAVIQAKWHKEIGPP